MIEPQPNPSPSIDAVDYAREHLLAPAGLKPATLDKAIARLMGRQLDYADLYFQATRFETWTVEDGIVKEGVHSIDEGVGVRAVVGERTDHLGRVVQRCSHVHKVGSA